MWFILIVSVRPLSVCLYVLFFLFRIAWWPSAGFWLSALAVLILCRLNCMCSFPVWCPGQDVEFDCIGS